MSYNLINMNPWITRKAWEKNFFFFFHFIQVCWSVYSVYVFRSCPVVIYTILVRKHSASVTMLKKNTTTINRCNITLVEFKSFVMSNNAFGNVFCNSQKSFLTSLRCSCPKNRGYLSCFQLNNSIDSFYDEVNYKRLELTLCSMSRNVNYKANLTSYLLPCCRAIMELMKCQHLVRSHVRDLMALYHKDRAKEKERLLLSKLVTISSK